MSARAFAQPRRRAWLTRHEENLQRLFRDNNWTDNLPIILPTEERVAAMLAHTSHKPDEVVGHMRSTHFREYWEYTVEKVAVNAVMAGAKPEYSRSSWRSRPLASAPAAAPELGGGHGGGQRADPARD